MKEKIVVIVFFVLAVIITGRANTISEFENYYQDTSEDLHERFFNNSDYNFSDIDYLKIEELYNFDAVKNDKVNYARVQYLDALIRHAEPSFDDELIIQILDSALSVLTVNKYPAYYAKLLILKGAVLINNINSYNEIYNNLTKAIELLKDSDPAFVGLAYNHLAILWIHLSDWEAAIDYIKKAERVFTDFGYERTAFFARSNSYTIYIRKGDFEEIIPEIQKDLSLAVALNDTTSALFLNILLGNAYVEQKELDKAHHYLFRAEHLISLYSNPLPMRYADIYYSLGRLFYLTSYYEKSIIYFEQALPLVRDLNFSGYESAIYKFLSKIYDEYGKKSLAYDYLESYVKLNDSLEIKEKANELQKIKTHSELLNFQQQLQINEQNTKIARTRSLLLIIILLLFLLIILFILFYINRKQKLKQLKIDQLNQELKSEEINNKLKKLELEKEIEEKEREMATAQLLVTEKNKVLMQLEDTLKPYYNSSQVSQEVWRDIQLFVSNNIKKEAEWDKSKMHFEKVHPDFYKRLKDYCPDLTENDLRLCTYIRIGMRSKEIADMLSIDHKSVISNRYRLKKKLCLPKDIVLEDFIRNI